MKLLPFLLLLPTFVSADPGPATKYLMNEPASLFDLGVHRADAWMFESKEYAQRIIHALGDKDAYITLAVSFYDVDDDLIVMEYRLIDSKNERRSCENMTRGAGLSVGIIMRWFSHAGYTTSGRPEDLDP